LVPTITCENILVSSSRHAFRGDPQMRDGRREHNPFPGVTPRGCWAERGRAMVAEMTRLNEAADLRDQGRLQEAEAAYRSLIADSPDDPEAHHHLAGVLAAQDRLAEAEAEYRRTLQLAPQAAGVMRVLGVLLLSQGRFEEGFALYEARHALPEMAKPPLPYPEWRGEPLAGKRLLIWPEQGFGDQIHFARFAPILRDQGVDVTLVCQPPLARLFAASLGVRVVAAEGAAEFPDPDAWVMAMSLAARMGVTAEAIPNAPYLRAATPPQPRPSSFRVGLVTAGRPTHANDANRSLPPDLADRLRGMAADVVELDPARSGARDFADTAALIDGLDLVVSVDTAVAHLAGAMGKPTWTLIPAVSTDWRWMRGRRDSPWYPSMRLYRQPAAGAWAPVVSEVLADVAVAARAT
jgi:tetratricopeptide (TPR) repeat protein